MTNGVIGLMAAGLAVACGAIQTAHAQEMPLKFQCVVQDATIGAQKTHIRCANRGLNGLWSFAAETNQPYASQVAMAAVQALRGRRALLITYAPDPALNPPGCPAQNCRKIIDVVALTGQEARGGQPPEQIPPQPRDVVDPALAAPDGTDPDPSVSATE